MFWYGLATGVVIGGVIGAGLGIWVMGKIEKEMEEERNIWEER